MSIAKHLRAVIGALAGLAAIWPAVRWVLDWGGRADFIISHFDQTKWMAGVLNFLIDPPPWSSLPLLAAGLLLIWWDIRRNRPTHAAAGSPLTMTRPPQSYSSPNETPGRSGFASLETAAGEIYGRLGPCTLRDWIDGAATGEHERLRMTAVVMLPYLALPGCQVWGIKPPSRRFEQISYLDLTTRPLRLMSGAFTLSDDADARGYYRSLMVRDDAFADIWKAMEEAKNQPPVSPPIEPSVPVLGSNDH